MEVNNIEGQKLFNVELVYDKETESNFLDKIILYFEETVLTVRVDIDYDEIILEYSENLSDYKSYKQNNILSKYINQKVVFTWKCVNYKEYFDIFILAFKNCLPDILIYSTGSSLDIFELNQTKI